MRIALIEDDTAQSQQVEHWLTEAGHHCHVYSAGEPFLKAFRKESFDLLILDWNLPDLDGDAILRRLRETDRTTPVLFTTSRDSERDIVTALEAGADDYLIKPLRQAETLARAAALHRRFQHDGDDTQTLEVPPYVFDSTTRTVYRDNAPITLTEREFDLACFLFRNHSRLLSRGHLLESVWGTRADLNTRTVDTHASTLRRKLGLGTDNPWRLTSIYQYGYRLEHKENK